MVESFYPIFQNYVFLWGFPQMGYPYWWIVYNGNSWSNGWFRGTPIYGNPMKPPYPLIHNPQYIWICDRIGAFSTTDLVPQGMRNVDAPLPPAPFAGDVDDVDERSHKPLCIWSASRRDGPRYPCRVSRARATASAVSVQARSQLQCLAQLASVLRSSSSARRPCWLRRPLMAARIHGPNCSCSSS